MAKSLKNKKINQIMYISLGVTIFVILLIIGIFQVITGKNTGKTEGVQISENTNLGVAEETNFSIGKRVEETEEYEEVQEENEKLTDVTVKEGTLGEDLYQATEKETEENVQTINENEKNSIEEVADVIDEVEIEDEEKLEEEDTKDPTFSRPVEGEIVKAYGKEKLIYSDTLKEWTTHLGIDIKADKTTIVKAAADGKVKSIKNDPRYGLTIVIEHKNGFSSVYSNLLTAEFVIVGENVKSGQTLGTVGNSATFEILDSPHLHFEIMKDGNTVDPEMYIK